MEKKELVDGLNDCTNKEYHSDRKYLSSSVLKTVYKSLEKYHLEYIKGVKEPVSDRTQSTFDEGSLVHSLILEPHLVKEDFLFYTGLRKAGQEYEDFLRNVSPKDVGKPIISTPQHIRCLDLHKAYTKHDIAKQLISGGFAEQTICGTLHGVPIKTRFDYINVDKGYIADVKTTSYPSTKEAFSETIEQYMYQLSAALYCSMASLFYKKPFVFYFIVLSKKDKTCHVYKLSDERMFGGQQIVAEACKKYIKAKESGNWTEEDMKHELQEEIEDI